MADYIKYVLNGSFPDAGEKWSTSVSVEEIGPITPPSPSDLQGWAEDIRVWFGTVTAESTLLKGYWSSEGRLDSVDAYYYPSVGANASVQGSSTGGAVSGSGTLQQAAQVACVFSLLTGQAGRSFRGRMYWPAQGCPLTSTMRGGLPSQSSANAMAVFLNYVASITLTGNGNVVVVSPTLGIVTPVTQVRVGDVLDTQRRRRDKTSETTWVAAV